MQVTSCFALGTVGTFSRDSHKLQIACVLASTIKRIACIPKQQNNDGCRRRRGGWVNTPKQQFQWRQFAEEVKNAKRRSLVTLNCCENFF